MNYLAHCDVACILSNAHESEASVVNLQIMNHRGSQAPGTTNDRTTYFPFYMKIDQFEFFSENQIGT